MLAGKRATAHPAFSDRLSNQEAVAQRVVVDGQLVTSRRGWAPAAAAGEVWVRAAATLRDRLQAETRVAAAVGCPDGTRHASLACTGCDARALPFSPTSQLPEPQTLQGPRHRL